MLKIADAINRLSSESALAILDRAAALQAKGMEIVSLGIGQPDFEPAPHIIEAGRKALQDGPHGYTPPLGLPGLRRGVAAHLNRLYGAEVDPDCVAIMPGGKVTMTQAVTLFGQAGAEIIYPDPGFPIYHSLISWSGATPVPLPLTADTAFAPTAEAVLSRITDKTRLIILNSPGNPTGGVMAAQEVEKLAEGLRAHHQVALMSDEIYGRITYDGNDHKSFLEFPDIADQVIVLDGWSKAYAMTGWRMGFAVWPKSLIGHVEKLAINAHSCVNVAAQMGGLAALEGPQDFVEDMRQVFARRRDHVVARLNAMEGISCLSPGGAFYCFPDASQSGWGSRALADGLLEKAGVVVLDGAGFGKLGAGKLRLSYATSMEKIDQALDRMAAFLQNEPART